MVFIDWYQTLSSNTFFDCIKKDKKVFNDLQKALFIDNKLILLDWMRGKISKNEVIALIHKSNPIYSENFIFDIIERSCRSMQFDSPLFQPLIQNLRKNGKKVVIATDNMDTFSDFTVPELRLNDVFDDILSSDKLQCVKDDIVDNKMVFFDNYLQKHKILPTEVILIDDGEKTTSLCLAHGMNSCCVKSQNEVIDILRKLDLCI